VPWAPCGNNVGAMIATVEYAHADSAPTVERVFMSGARCRSPFQPSLTNRQPGPSTTAVAQESCSQRANVPSVPGIAPPLGLYVRGTRARGCHYARPLSQGLRAKL
jgi:hypothetical protein